MYLNTDNKNIKVKNCKSIFAWLFGLMFKIEPINIGWCFPKRNMIHTFFAYQPVDVVMTDKNNKILYLYQNIKPWHVILPKNDVYCTYAFGANTLDDYSISDKLNIKKIKRA